MPTKRIKLIDSRFGLWRIDPSMLTKEEIWRMQPERTLLELNPQDYWGAIQKVRDSHND